MDELIDGTKSVLSGERDVAENKVFAHPLPFNVIPHIDKFQDNGYTKEEMKVTWETRKICGLADDFPVRLVDILFSCACRIIKPSLNIFTCKFYCFISCTAVRIPTSRAHSESIVALFEKPVDVAAARKALEDAPGVSLKDDPENLVRMM
jgi:aspartate-semialdehyde dehydrogenase